MSGIFLDIAIDEIYIQNLPIICMVDQTVKDVIYKFFTYLSTGRIQSSLGVVPLNPRNIDREFASSFAKHAPEAFFGGIRLILNIVIHHLRHPPALDTCRCNQ